MSDDSAPSSDESYRKRLIEVLPEGHVNTAEDIGNASGEELDAIGERYNYPRKGSKYTGYTCKHCAGGHMGINCPVAWEQLF